MLRKRIISNCSSLSETSDGKCYIKSKKKRKNSCQSTKEPDIFELGYKKWFICRFCNYQSRNKSKIMKHMNTHSSMIQKYTNLIKHDCYVKLDKLDNKPNICKSKKYVVHSSDKITHYMHNFYHVIIRPKETSNNISDGGSVGSLLELNYNYRSDDSNDTIPIGLKNRRRKNRILSNDTVVIEKDDLDSSMLNSPLTHEAPAKPNVTEMNEKECISIDDSDSESIKSGEALTNGGTNLSSSVNNSEYKTINNIISLCYKKHLKRLESNDTIDANMPCLTETQATKLDSHIKHKVLSIGKKMINNSPFSCTGILRYLEHQNLEIVWTPNIPKTSNKKTDCVRIMMKLKSHDENDSSESGWTVLQNPNQVDRIEDADSTGGGAVLSAINIGQEKDKILRKLLNENPVPNPKKLTKKPQGANSSVSKKKKIKNKEDKSVPVDMPIIETDDNVVTPLITSTVSLAPSGEGVKQQPAFPVSVTPIAGPSKIQSNLTDTAIPEQTNFPRIKVKSASQLMSNPALNVMTNQYIPQPQMFAQIQNVNMAYQNTNGINMNIAPLPRFDNAIGFPTNAYPQTLLETNPGTSMPMSYENNSVAKVVMNSIDLPNTTTTSPFKYLKRLLQIHNIYLLSPEEIGLESIRDYICLLKFKLVFQQESASPVALCLALYNLKDRFFIKVKGVNDAEIDICKLSPNWQWEILKVYSGEVVSKMLENAEKVSPEVLMITRNFVCYLQSIEFRKNV